MAKETQRLGDDLIVGAGPLAAEIFGDEKERQRVYRLKGWPIFNIGFLKAGRRSQLRKHIEELEREAIEESNRAASNANAEAAPAG